MDSLLSCPRKYYYTLVNTTIGYRKLRWTTALALSILYIWRALSGSYDVVTYLIGFYILQLIIGYFTPKGLEDDQQCEDMAMDCNELIESTIPINIQGKFENSNDYGQEGGSGVTGSLSANSNTYQGLSFSEDKPLVSMFGQYEIWSRMVVVLLLGILCTRFKELQIDVFWPILMLYFIVLVAYTLVKIAKKMHKYKYSLADFGKKIILSQVQNMPPI